MAYFRIKILQARIWANANRMTSLEEERSRNGTKFKRALEIDVEIVSLTLQNQKMLHRIEELEYISKN